MEVDILYRSEGILTFSGAAAQTAAKRTNDQFIRLNVTKKVRIRTPKVFARRGGQAERGG
jgi:hypothetical protein